MSRDVERLSSLPDARAAHFGNKARTLARLSKKGFRVPAGFAVASDVAARIAQGVLGPNDQLPALLSYDPPDAEHLAELERRIAASVLPTDVRNMLSGVHDLLRADAPCGLAVRSSSTLEDDSDASSAGMNATVLAVRTDEELFAAFLSCVASLYSPRAVAYLRARPRGRAPGMGVVIQAMVRSELSGVGFSQHPLTGDDHEVVLELAYGLGTSVANGEVSPDVIRVDKATFAIRDKVIGTKSSMSSVSPSGGVELREVPSTRREQLCVDDALAAELARVVTRVERELGSAVDVEFAVADGLVHVIQARPITAAHRAPSRARANASRDRSRFVWSNINVGEALPGVATPFTWSVLSAFSELGFRRAFGALGCVVPDDAELVGEFRGRIYLNMSEFMRVLGQVPLVDPSVISALGGSDFAALIGPVEREGVASFLARLPVTGARFLRESLVVDGRVERFSVAFADERRRLEGIDLRLLSGAALDRTLLDVERLLDEIGGVMLTVYGSLLALVVLLDGWLRILARDEAASLERDLFTGLAAVESAAPGLLLERVARALPSDVAARDYLVATESKGLSLADFPAGPTRAALEHLLVRYGHRGFREAEICEPRWREDPSAILGMLRLNALAPDGELGARHDRIAHTRLAAERRLAELVPFLLRPFARALVARVQHLIGQRERLRSDVVAVLGAFRVVMLEVSRRIASREPEAGLDAGFFLTLDETHAYLGGTLHGVGALVSRRRTRYERDRALPDPASTFVGQPDDEPVAQTDERVMRGLAASGGSGEGAVRILRSSADLDRMRHGDVLVVPSCDVGWSPLFLHASAVVTDLGGPLSHAAIVLRELGVPAVVNVREATRTLREGEIVAVDGDRGTVTRLTAGSLR